ncbi:hypothetical protein P5673_022806, partial [Acropora cervicornis]
QFRILGHLPETLVLNRKLVPWMICKNGKTSVSLFEMKFLKKMKINKLTYTMSSANFGFFSCAICLGLHLEWVIKLTLTTVDHSAMLFGQHRSFQLFSNQGFETSHKEQRRFCYQATDHDSSADGQSKVLGDYKLWVSGLLFVALDGQRQMSGGLRVETAWMQLVTNLFLKLFGEDYLKNVYSADHGTQIEEVSDSSRCFTLQS